MTRASTRWALLALVSISSIGAGCGDDPAPSRGAVHLQPVPGCESIDPTPCDVFATDCETKLMNLAACMRGSAPQPLPTITRMTEAEYAQWLTAQIAAEPPPPNLSHYEYALVMMRLVVAGAFQPSSMAAAQASQVWGVYRHDEDDILLIERDRPGDDIDVNSVLLHEFVHALQDRDQDLTIWYDAHTSSYDDTLSAMSVVEGEARLHQERFGESLLGLDPNAVDLARHFDNAVRLAEDWVRMQPSPYTASYSGFPYEFGARRLLPRFAQQGPQAIADSFAAPPAGTRILLDPASSDSVPAWTAPAAPTPTADWTLTQAATLGAWGVFMLLAQDAIAGDADVQARSWRGDRLWVYGGSGATVSATATVVVWRIAFADSAMAASVAQRLSARFTTQASGNEVTIAGTDSGASLVWAFAPPAQSAAAAGDEGLALATDSSASAWLSRIFRRTY